MSHALDMTVVAEGVETESQRRALVAFRCDELQSFLIARSLPEDEFLKLLA